MGRSYLTFWGVVINKWFQFLSRQASQVNGDVPREKYFDRSLSHLVCLVFLKEKLAKE
jgi:hypothetical protein